MLVLSLQLFSELVEPVHRNIWFQLSSSAATVHAHEAPGRLLLDDLKLACELLHVPVFIQVALGVVGANVGSLG